MLPAKARKVFLKFCDSSLWLVCWGTAPGAALLSTPARMANACTMRRRSLLQCANKNSFWQQFYLF